MGVEVVSSGLPLHLHGHQGRWGGQGHSYSDHEAVQVRGLWIMESTQHTC